MFTVWCCCGNPDGLFDFHLSASHHLPLLPAVWSQALSTCEKEGYTNRLELYILCVCSVFPAGYFKEHVCFCEFFLTLLCHILRFACGSFFSNFLVKSRLCNVGQHWVKETRAAWQFDRSQSYLRKINLYLNFYFFIFGSAEFIALAVFAFIHLSDRSTWVNRQLCKQAVNMSKRNCLLLGREPCT